jgi:hypothetical protein
MNSPYNTPFGKDFPLDAREHATIGNVRNFTLASNQAYHFSPNIQKFVSDITQLITTDPRITYAALERRLRDEYGTGEITEDGIRLSLALALTDTQIVRQADTMITVDQIPQNNIVSDVIDPFGWASRPVAPGENYWLFWKTGLMENSVWLEWWVLAV